MRPAARSRGLAPTGAYPDTITYASTTGRPWVSNKTGSTQTVVDADSGRPVDTAALGDEAGNVMLPLALPAEDPRSWSPRRRERSLHTRPHRADCHTGLSVRKSSFAVP